MSRSSRPFFLLALLLASLFATAASAASYYDPPGRVARLSHSQGELSYSPAGENGWYGIQRNRPLVRGDRLWTDQRALAELQVGSAAIRLDHETSIEILELSDHLVQLDLSQGSLNLRVRRLYPGQEFEVATPSLAFVIDRPGSYRIDVDPRYGRTTLVVWQGSGVAYGDDGQFQARAGDAVSFYGNDLRDYDLFGLPRMDQFDRYCLDRDRRLERSMALRYMGDDVIGYSDLDDYGYWRSTPGYGNVWYPSQVGSNWAPYRDGQWIWQEPWGWTWVDDAPWGFAPSHYGRWANISNRWGWIPGPRNYRPVYAPALVVFIGSSGWSLLRSLGDDFSVGWFPLGPRDVYYPPYQASRNYFSQVNVSNTVINNTTINNVYNNYSSGNINVSQTNYANRAVADAITAVPVNAFVSSRPVRASALRLDRNAFRNGELTRVAPIAPKPRSVLGTGTAARARPTREALDRPVFVRTPPPAVERPFVEREKRLQQKPGRPLQMQPEPRAQDSVQRNIRVIKDKGAKVDTRAAGPRRTDADGATTPTTPAQPATPTRPATPPPLDRSINRRPAPTVTPPAETPPQTWQQRQAENRQQASAQAEAQAKATAEAQARADKQAKAREEAMQAQAKQRDDAMKAREEAMQARTAEQAKERDEAMQAREEAMQARTAAQAKERDEALQARTEAQAKARLEAQARAEAAAQSADPTAAAAAAQANRDAQSAARAARRRPPNCLTVEEVEELTKKLAAGEELPAYVPCRAGGD